jgi:regulator of sigma E protease
MTFVIFILILVALILAHEFGHFIVAKMCGIRVDEFGIFFPPRLFAFKWGETEYSLNLLPFGGFVKIFGENGEENPPSKNLGGDGQTAEQFGDKNFLKGDSRSFTTKPKWQQALVVVAGIVCNLLVAWLILAAAYMHGIPTSVDHEGVGQVQDAHPTIVGVLPNSPADKAGLKAGDVITKIITGRSELANKGATAQDIQEFISEHQNESLGFAVMRDGQAVSAIATPAEGLAAGKKVVGVELGDVGILQLPPQLALVQGALLGKEITISTAQGLTSFFSQIFRGQANFSEVSGPVGIVGLGSSAVQQGFIATALLTALISINLAILNLIPIPGLDGGKLLFIAIEAITKRPISQKISVAFTFVGLALLVLLMLVVSFHDVARLVHPAA